MPLEATEIAAAIAVGGVLISAFVAYSTASRTVYVNSVTSARLKWNEELRATIRRHIELSHQIVVPISAHGRQVITREPVQSQLYEMMSIIHTMELRLGSDNKVEKNVLDLIFCVADAAADGNNKDLSVYSILLTGHTSWLLKDEWQRIKMESSTAFHRMYLQYKRYTRRKAYLAYASGDGTFEKIAESQINGLLADAQIKAQVDSL